MGINSNTVKYLRLRYFLEAIMIVLCSPIIAIVFGSVYLYVFSVLKKNIIFSQSRPGLHSKSFIMYKFRTMNDQGRVEPKLAFLRHYRLDEIPQFWNILIGDMSLIGPRPEPMEYYNRIIKRFPEYKQRYVIKPGLTGLAQTEFIHTESVDDSISKFKYDMQYLSNINFAVDCRVILKTFAVISNGDGDAQKLSIDNV